jgi:hypothetical protein
MLWWQGITTLFTHLNPLSSTNHIRGSRCCRKQAATCKPQRVECTASAKGEEEEDFLRKPFEEKKNGF